MATAVVALWMTAGWLLHTRDNTYLLLGVPLTFGYQKWIAKRPIHTLWVRDAPRFQLDQAGVAIAIMLAVAPTYALVRGLAEGNWDLASIGWLICAIAGGLAAAFAFRSFTSDTLRALLACLATAGVIGIALMIRSRTASGGSTNFDPLTAMRSLLLYLPLAFVIEEVFFRGALDAHIHRPGEARPWTSAIFVSVLWGLWHLPLVRYGSFVGVIIVHTAIGVPLSIYWRKSGNLAVPAVVHVVIDAVRNAL